MGLFEDLPLLDGWEYVSRPLGYTAQAPPVTIGAGRPLFLLPQGRGWLFQCELAFNDPNAQILITIDQIRSLLTPLTLFRFGSTGPFPNAFTTPISGRILTEAPQFGPLYGFRYEGFNAPLAYKNNVSVSITSSVANAALVAGSLDLVSIIDPAAFVASVQTLYGGTATQTGALVARYGTPPKAANVVVQE